MMIIATDIWKAFNFRLFGFEFGANRMISPVG